MYEILVGKALFRMSKGSYLSDDYKKKIGVILCEDVEIVAPADDEEIFLQVIPEFFTNDAKDLISKLVIPNPRNRLD